MVVGATTINPGETTTLAVSMTMGKGMGGPHLFEVTVNSGDPAPTVNKVSVRVDYQENKPSATGTASAAPDRSGQA